MFGGVVASQHARTKKMTQSRNDLWLPHVTLVPWEERTRHCVWQNV